ncbi:cyclophilin-like fold protein [Faecalicatena fissicatena]|nr:cyclophilin-like fold protein [Faecalicatena fissicatena]
MNMNIEVNETDIQVKLCENSSARAVEELLRDGPLTLEMKDFAHMEKFGSLGAQLPANDEHITTEAGDVILSEGNLLVIYYAPNTWNFTRLGKVQNLSEKELKDVLGKGNIRATLTIEEKMEGKEER